MENKTKKVDITQGVETTERKMQLTVKQLRELAENPVLMEHFITAVESEDKPKSIMAMGIARAMVKQTKMEV